VAGGSDHAKPNFKQQDLRPDQALLQEKNLFINKHLACMSAHGCGLSLDNDNDK
jgi:hypothetical protein